MGDDRQNSILTQGLGELILLMKYLNIPLFLGRKCEGEENRHALNRSALFPFFPYFFPFPFLSLFLSPLPSSFPFCFIFFRSLLFIFGGIFRRGDDPPPRDPYIIDFIGNFNDIIVFVSELRRFEKNLERPLILRLLTLKRQLFPAEKKYIC